MYGGGKLLVVVIFPKLTLLLVCAATIFSTPQRSMIGVLPSNQMLAKHQGEKARRMNTTE